MFGVSFVTSYRIAAGHVSGEIRVSTIAALCTYTSCNEVLAVVIVSSAMAAIYNNNDSNSVTS